MIMKQHFVTFYSPGTFVPELTTRPIDSWDVPAASTMAHEITERHGATPYAFRFTTRSRGESDLDSKETDRSGTYFLGGTIRTAEEVLAGTDKDDEILRSNVRVNGLKKIIRNDNSWRFIGEFRDGDVLLDWKPRRAPATV